MGLFKDIFGPSWDSDWVIPDGTYTGPAIDLMPNAPPKLTVVGADPTRDEFEAWRDHHVTQFAFAAAKAEADVQERAWTRASWEGGKADQLLLTELRARADTWRAIIDSDYDAFCESLGIDGESK